MGVSVDVVARHALDGLSAEQIEALAPAPGEPAIHCHLRTPGATGSRLGPDWTETWVARAATELLVQARIDELEDEHGVGATIYCVAEWYPPGTFRSRRPLILPARNMLAYGQAVAESNPEATIGLLVYGARQRQQQLDTWRWQPWGARLRVEFGELGSAPLDAAARLRDRNPDLVFYWGYGVGLAPAHRADLIERLEEMLGQPVITPQNAAALFARNLFRPSVPGRTFSLKDGS
jgi:hypothetical protein